MIENKINKLIDSRYLKILSSKKDDLKDSVVFIEMSTEKFGDKKNNLQEIVEQIESIEPSGIYFPVPDNISIKLCDRGSFQNRDILVNVNCDNIKGDESRDILDSFEKQVREAISEARSIKFVYLPQGSCIEIV